MSGAIAMVGHGIAAMLNGEFHRFSDQPVEDIDRDEPEAQVTLDQVRRSIDLEDVQRIFLGFPIWNGGPTELSKRVLLDMDLSGIAVIPFFIYEHWYQPESLADLAEILRSLGASPKPPMGFLHSETTTDEQFLAQVHRTLIHRRDAWGGGTVPVSRPSCHPGPARHGTELCLVPAGMVWLGEDGDEDSPRGYLRPRLVSWIGAFEIDRAEVTQRQWNRCRQAGICPTQDQTPSFQSCRDPSIPDLPVTGASLKGARAYCSWVGMRLPTEAEWIRAGRGDRAHAYPWGDEFPGHDGPLRGNFGEKPSTGLTTWSLVPEDELWPDDGYATLAPVCRFPTGSSSFGLCDLAGNAPEWVLKTDEPGSPVQYLKGGWWFDGTPYSFRLAARIESDFDDRGGFRCVRTVGAHE